MSNYKNTLNLPRTKFPMRGNLAQSEPLILQRWYDDNLYSIVRKAKKGCKIFILHDGPPYANGKIHIGHSVNKILKDIIIKAKGMEGYDSPYIPGWDCHGLPIEQKVEQIIGKPNIKINTTTFRNACRQYATTQVEDQKKDFIRLGILGDWEHPYLTMNFQTEANTIRALSKIINNGHLYKGEKPVYWCFECRSVLAEAEVEYYEIISPSIYVMFDAIDSQKILAQFGVQSSADPTSLVIWTTTPWTIPANRGISLHKNFKYQLLKIKNRNIILAKELVKSVMNHIGLQDWIVLGECQGNSLEFQLFKHPLLEKITSKVVLGEHVTLTAGTGAVHTAPCYGPEDYIIGQKYDLEQAHIVDLDGVYLNDIHENLNDMNIFQANEIIIELLKEKGALLNVKQLQHSYPHCWRHKKPIIFRTTPQWFISMDKEKLREKSLKVIKNVQWIPNWGQERIESMITNRPDWCISRQRAWSVPMALFVHKKTEKLHPNTLYLMEKVAQLVEKDGIQAWWDLKLHEFLGNDAEHYIKVTDTLDVWFDSGSTSYTVVNNIPDFGGYVSDMYLEGSDQHRGWFMSSLMISVAMNNKAPYYQVLTHGFTVDGEGRKMSKSIGNIISPMDIINKFGADVLRLWVASTNYCNEITVSEEILKRTADTYRRIRNTARFLLANLIDFNPETDCIQSSEMIVIDRWAVGRALTTQQNIIKSYAKYDFHDVIKHVMYFCSIEMSSFYLDVIKDRQYTAKRDCLARRSCQTALWHISEALVRWLAPILSFTADEIWNYLPGKHKKYVFTEEWYEKLFSLDINELMNNSYWSKLLIVRNEVNKLIEQERINKRIGSSLEVAVTLYANSELAVMLRELGDELCFILLTSSAIVDDYDKACDKAQQSELLKGLKIFLSKAKGNKCPRCWHYKTDMKDHNFISICTRCYTNLIGNGEVRKYA